MQYSIGKSYDIITVCCGFDTHRADFDSSAERGGYMQFQKRVGTIVRLMSLLMLFAVPFMCVRTDAASTNMIAYADSKETPSGKLLFTSKGVCYRYSDGTYAKNVWIKVEKDYYCFDKNGYAEDGWFSYSGNTYYADDNGKVFHKSWHKEGSSKFYLKDNGVLAKSQWVETGNKVYIVDKNGRMIKNKYFKVGGKYYYVNKNGQRVENGWATIKGKKYFFNADGVRLSSTWIKYKKKYYYVKADGSMAVNEDVGKYHVGKKGALSGYSAEYKKYSKPDYLFVGDSRTVGMSNAVSNSKVAFYGKVSMGYSWLKSTADGEVKKYLKYNPSIKIIFGFGVNDLGNINSYINYYSGLIKAYPKAKFYFLSVNPMVEAKWSNKLVTNKKIKAFNKKLSAAFKSRYINTYSYLTKKGFETNDGLHYTAATYKKIFTYVKKAIG